MNNLNSVLLEGTLTESPRVFSTAEDPNTYVITLVSHHLHERNGKMEEETSYFDIIAFEALGHRCWGLQVDQKIRVVGRLKQMIWIDSHQKPFPKTVIMAEYVESMMLERDTIPY